MEGRSNNGRGRGRCTANNLREKQRRAKETKKQRAGLNNGNGYSKREPAGAEDEADAKLQRLEGGQRSPMVGLNVSMNNNNNNYPVNNPMNGMNGAAPLIYPSPLNKPSMTSSPNPLHPLNNPHKSKPN